MKIMYVTSECAPFIKTGGLGDVAGSLPKALAAKGHDVRVFCPLYSAISEEMREKFFYIKNAYVRLGWRNQYCGIFRYEKDGVTYYFIDNEYYFARGQIYGEYDDAERFAYYSKAVLEVRGTRIAVEYPLVGRFNVENVMTAFGCALALGIPTQIIAEALATMPAVPGRLERVRPAVDAPVSVYVDYAHTPDALTKAIASIKELSHGRTIVVFGCGGNRDATKRPIMGAAALAADYAVVTSDNPRHEEPDAIIADIVAGMEDAERFTVEPDRRSAIAAAIALARPGDAILVAGKGHEDYQLVGDEVLSFDDRVVAAEELERAFGGACSD